MAYEPAYKNLNVYKKADELALLIYRVTKNFPKEELFGLISQMRRCAVSVPANIVEGYGRRTKKDQAHFCYIARGSLNELEYYLDLALNLGFLNKGDKDKLLALRYDVGRLLNGFLLSLEK